jgi:hypothetical protein
MVLLHGGSPRGAERIAPHGTGRIQARLEPPWQGGPFKRNDQMLEALPVGLIAFPGSGISANLADKVRRMSIPLRPVCAA